MQLKVGRTREELAELAFEFLPEEAPPEHTNLKHTYHKDDDKLPYVPEPFDYIGEYQLEIENRIRNLVWTVCGDYTLEARPDLELYRKSPDAALYDAVKQGALSRYFDRELLSTYLIKKVYMGALEKQLVNLAQLCIEAAVGRRIGADLPGSAGLRRKAFEAILAIDGAEMKQHTVSSVKAAFMEEELGQRSYTDRQMEERLSELYELCSDGDTMDLVAKIDYLYNHWLDRDFVRKHGNLSDILRVSFDELSDFDWKDYLTEEMMEENLEDILKRMNQEMVTTQKLDRQEEKEKSELSHRKVTYVTEEELSKVYSYIERNFGRTWLTPLEEKKLNFTHCRGIHSDCGLYLTHGILENPVVINYQYEYARKQLAKNRYALNDYYRVVKQNIQQLTEIFRKTLVLKDEESPAPSDYGTLVPSRVWRAGRVSEPRLFVREEKSAMRRMVVDILIDASGSQRPRQEQVVLQAYILMEALSNIGIPHRVTGFCTFWDYTILQRYREYDDDRRANDRIFGFTTSSNNRDGLAVRVIGSDLLNRSEEKKILLILSDGRPYDVIANRPNARNPQPYRGSYAIRDTATEIRRLRNNGVAVLGIFAGEPEDLEAEKRIFGKDFAYIKDLGNFCKVTGRYLKKQMEES